MPSLESTAALRTLGRAVDVAGSLDALANFLGLRVSDMRHWAAGSGRLPTRVLIALIDVVSANRLEPRALRNLARRPNASWAGPERRRTA